MTRTWGDEHFLGAVGPGTGDAQVTVRAVRPVGREEWERLVQASYITSRFRPIRVFADLKDAHERLVVSVGRVEVAAFREARFLSEDVRRLEGSMREWLTQFRAFEDHTKSAISECFGEDLSLKNTVNNVFSAEYDTNLAYRLACALRNVSQHRGRVINGSRLTTREAEPRVDLFLGFDCRALAAANKRLSARIRGELSAIDEPLSLRLVIDSVMLGCERILGSILLAINDLLMTEADFIEGLHQEATGTSDEDSALMEVITDATGKISSMKRSHIPDGVRANIEKTHSECAYLLSMPKRAVEVGHLT